MNIYSAEQMRRWDQYTMAHEPVSSINLMERAAESCIQWILKQRWKNIPFYIFCGPGNNGGDGLAVARMLIQRGRKAFVFCLEHPRTSPDFLTNFERLQQHGVEIHQLNRDSDFPDIDRKAVIIDALFGMGLHKPLEGLPAALVTHLNASGAKIIAIDLPSGLLADTSSRGSMIVKAHVTLTFQTYKRALLLPENAGYAGKVEVMDIGLHPQFQQQEESSIKVITEQLVASFYKPRSRFLHKGDFGHALIMGGSHGKNGAAILAAKACLRTGAGLLTVHIPADAYLILQSGVPEAMCLTDPEEKIISQLPDLERYTAIGAGPGMGTAPDTQKLIADLMKKNPAGLVMDADALNCLSLQPQLMDELPPGTILTPHPKEFSRLFGGDDNDFQRIERTSRLATEKNIFILLKGHHSFVAFPDGRGYFNITGNAGLAKGGSGDVLTGMITAFLAQGYHPGEALLTAVWMHGRAADIALREQSPETLLPSDLFNHFPHCFRQLEEAQKRLRFH